MDFEKSESIQKIDADVILLSGMEHWAKTRREICTATDHPLPENVRMNLLHALAILYGRNP